MEPPMPVRSWHSAAQAVTTIKAKLVVIVLSAMAVLAVTSYPNLSTFAYRS